MCIDVRNKAPARHQYWHRHQYRGTFIEVDTRSCMQKKTVSRTRFDLRLVRTAILNAAAARAVDAAPVGPSGDVGRPSRGRRLSHHPSPSHHRGEYVLECASVCEPSQGSVGQCVHASRDAQYECEQNPRVLRKGRGSKETWEARLYQLAGIAVSATREPACAGPEGSPGANRWARAIARRPSAQRE